MGTRKQQSLLEEAESLVEREEMFGADRACMANLERARRNADFGELKRTLDVLGRARAWKRARALEAGGPRVLDDQAIDTSTMEIEAGTYLLEPLLVGADGRVLRERAESLEIPVLVMVREPATQLGMWPVVMVGPATVRTRIDPPDAGEGATDAWIVGAAGAMGQEALRQVENETTIERRVEALLDRIMTLHYDEAVFAAAMEACDQAASAGV